MNMGFDISELFEDHEGLVRNHDLVKEVNKRNAPILDAMAQELIGLMHKYGVYFNPASHFLSEKEMNGLEIGVGFERIFFDSDGDLTKQHGADGFSIFPIHPPTTHQKMAQMALHKKLLAEAKDRPEGGAA